jgi:hypothetical protein
LLDRPWWWKAAGASFGHHAWATQSLLLLRAEDSRSPKGDARAQ